MTGEYDVAFEFGHGRLYYSSDPYGPKVDRPLPHPDEDSLVSVLGDFRPGIKRITLVRLDCPYVNLTDQERIWNDISTTSLQRRLDIPVRHDTDINLLVQGLAARDEPIRFPYGVLILHDSDNPRCGGFVRKYRVTGRMHRRALPFKDAIGDDAPIVGVGSPQLSLSHSSNDVREVIARFMADHPNLQRLVVWSPDDLPIQYSTYNQPRENGEYCRVTMLTNNAFVLRAALQA